MMVSFRCLEARGKSLGIEQEVLWGCVYENAFSTRPELHALTAGAEQVVQGPRGGEG